MIIRNLILAGLFGIAVSAAATEDPVFVTDLPDIFMPLSGTFTIGVDVFDPDSADVTVTVESDTSDITWFISTGNRYAHMHWAENDGTPIGTIAAELFETRGGLATQRIIDLSTKGYDDQQQVVPDANPFYTNVFSHRITELIGNLSLGLIIQAGLVTETASESPLDDFIDQFDLQEGLNFNGFGVLGMANQSDPMTNERIPNTNNSQFFIANEPVSHLNDGHMIFGQVTSGQPVIDFLGRLNRNGATPAPLPKITSIDIVNNTQDAAITFKTTDTFTANANVTVTLDDGEGHQTQQTMKVLNTYRKSSVISGSADSGAYMTVADGNNLYIANGIKGVDVYNISDFDNPVFIKNFDTSGEVRDIEIVSYDNPPRKRAIVADANGGLLLLDIDTPQSISQLDRVSVLTGTTTGLEGDAFDVEVDDNKILYVATSSRPPANLPGGLTTFDVSNSESISDRLSSPLYISITGSGISLNVVGVVVKGNRAYMIATNFGLLVADVSNPNDISGSLINEASREFNTPPNGIARRDNNLYVTVFGDGSDNSSGFFIYDISDPAIPPLSSIALAQGTASIMVNDELAITSHPGAGFSLVNITNPSSPRLEQFFNTDFQANRALILGDKFIFPAKNSKIYLVDNSRQQDPEITVIRDGVTGISSDISLVSKKSVIDFGVIAEEADEPSEMLTVRNDGDELLTASLNTLPNGFSLVTSLSSSISAGGSDDFMIKPNTTVVGSYEGKVRIDTNDYDEEAFEFYVKATVKGNSSVNGTIWVDFDNDGNRDVDDIGLVGITVFLDSDGSKTLNNDELSTLTVADDPQTSENESGRYSFTDLESGTYSVRQIVPDHHTQSEPANDDAITVTVAASEIKSNADFGNFPDPGTLSGFVWQESNSNGTYDPTEDAKFANAVVFLDINNNRQLDSGEPQTVSDESGSYTFSNISPRPYAIIVQSSTGFVSAIPTPGPIITENLLIPISDRRDHVFDASRGNLIVSTAGGTIERYDISSKSLLNSISLGTSLNGIDITPDNQFLYVSENQSSGDSGRLYKVDLDTESQTTLSFALDAGETGVWDVNIGLNGNGLVSTVHDDTGTIRIRDLSTDLDIVSISVDNPLVTSAIHFVRSFDHINIMFAESNSTANTKMWVYNSLLKNDEFSSFTHEGIPLSNVMSGLNFNTSRIGIKANSNELLVINRFADEPPLRANIDGGLVFHPKRNLLYAVDSSANQIVAFTASSATELYRISINEDVTAATSFDRGVMSITDDGNTLFLSTPSGIRMFTISEIPALFVNLKAGQTVNDVNFGQLYVNSDIQGQIWNDLNGNGIREDGEPFTTGTRVYLDLNNNGIEDQNDISTVTLSDDVSTPADETGTYHFTNIKPGNYSVRQIPPVINTNISQQSSPNSKHRSRLFAIPDDGSSSIIELDINNGQEINRFAIPIEIDFKINALAYDGISLYLYGLNSQLNVLWLLNPENGLIRNIFAVPVPFIDGLAALNGLIYILDRFTAIITVYDPQRNVIINALDIPKLNNGVFVYGGLTANHLTNELISQNGNIMFFIDAETGLITNSFSYTDDDYQALSCINNRIYAGSSVTSQIHVLNLAGSITDTFDLPFTVSGLTGMTEAANANIVNLQPGQILTGINFSNAVPGIITTFVWKDSNKDGNLSGEAGFEDVSVFIHRDDGDSEFEPDGDDQLIESLLTDANGEIQSSLVPGNFWVEVDDRDDQLFGFGLTTGSVNPNPNPIPIISSADESISIGYKPLDAEIMTLNLHRGWNLVSLPLEPVDQDVDSVFLGSSQVDINGQAWMWNGKNGANQFVKAAVIHGLTGYWIYAKTAGNLDIEGYPILNPRVRLYNDWNMVGATDQMTVPNHVNLSPILWRWDRNKFINSNELIPKHGYWINSANTMEVKLGL